MPNTKTVVLVCAISFCALACILYVLLFSKVHIWTGALIEMPSSNIQHLQSPAYLVPSVGPQQSSHQCSNETSHNATSEQLFAYTVLTTNKFHNSRLRTIFDTWGKHAFIPFVVSDKTTKEEELSFSSPILSLGTEEDKAGKTMRGWKRFCSLHEDRRKRGEKEIDWFVMTDDDTFLVVHNLEAVLQRTYNPALPWYLGYRLNHTIPALIGGGGGVVLSRGTLVKLCPKLLAPGSPKCSAYHTGFPGDVAIAHCLDSIGVSAKHQEGFYPFHIREMVLPAASNWCKITWWYPKEALCPPISEAISFHYIALDRWAETYYWTYSFRRLR